MRNKSALPLLLLLAGLLLLADVSLTPAQQSTKDESDNIAADMNCLLPVVVNGAVRNPSRFELKRSLRLLEALALAGGLNEQSEGTIRVEHSGLVVPDRDKSTSNDAAARVENFDTYRVHDVLSEKANPYITCGDVVTALPAERVLVTGNVFRPQVVLLREPLTLTQSLAMTGGTLPGSKRDRVTITRRALGQKDHAVITVNVNAIAKRRAQDIALQPNDIVYVPGKKLNGCCSSGHVLNVTLSTTQPTTRVIY